MLTPDLKRAAEILQSDLSDGAKLAAIAMLTTGARTAKEIAAATNRSVRSVERHYAELRAAGYADSRGADTQNCVATDPRSTQTRVENYADLRSKDSMRAPARKDSRATNELLRSEESVSLPVASDSQNKHVRTRGGVGAGRGFEDSKIEKAPVENPPPAQNRKSPPAQKQNLSERLAAADDPTESDEMRFWAAVGVLEKAGLPRSMPAKLAKVLEDFGEAFAILVSVAEARNPTTYLGKIIRTREAEKREEQRQERLLSIGGDPDEPEFVRDYRREGYSPIYKRPDGNWEISRWTFSPAGEELAG